MHNQVVIDEDSVQLNVEMPVSERKKATTVIPNWEFSCHFDGIGQFKLLLCANETYVRNIIAKKQQMPAKDSKRSKMPAGTIVNEPFNVFLKEPDGVNDKLTDIQGQLTLTYLPYKGIKLTVSFLSFQPNVHDYFAARFRITDKDEKKTRTIRLEKEEGKTWSCLVEDLELDLFLNKYLAVEVELDREREQEQRFVGIRNEGNTCYMNSILQILFFMRPLRKMVIDYQGQGKILLALRDVFLGLMDGPDSRSGPVDAQELIEAYGRFAGYPRRQQDTHEFLLGFLEEIEGECPSLAQLWQGQSIQILESVQQEKPYSSKVKEDFNGLDLPLEDFKGNTFGEMYDSVKYLLQVEHVEDKIETQDFGKVSCKKSRQFLNLPPVLFLTLKRYQFKKSQIRPTKIMADLHYPIKINLGFLYGTPTGTDMEYQLYAVTVHRGQHYSSGHYYSFVNTSEDEQNPCWVKFDDSRVQLASQEQALNFTGGKRKTTAWNSEFERFMENQFVAQDTAYVLVYYKREVFKEYQKINVNIPKDWFEKKKKMRAQEHMVDESNKTEVQVAVLDFKADPVVFWSASTIPVGLDPHKDAVTQLKNFNSSFLGCKVGSVWKVSKTDRVIKKITQFADLVQSPARIFEPKRGHRTVDFLLIIPENSVCFKAVEMVNEGKQGLVVIRHMETDGVVQQIRLIDKSGLEDLIIETEIKLHKKVEVESEAQDAFQYGWNDYIQIFFQ